MLPLRMIVPLAAMITVAVTGSSPVIAADGQKQLSERLRHDYSLVTSMECVYDHLEFPTDPQLIPLIRKLYDTSSAVRALGSFESMIFTKENTASNCYRRHWY